MTAILITVVVGIAVALIGMYFENKEWNNGACSCGKGFWKASGMDSQGGVSYDCSAGCGNTIWQSWFDRSIKQPTS